MQSRLKKVKVGTSISVNANNSIGQLNILGNSVKSGSTINSVEDEISITVTQTSSQSTASVDYSLPLQNPFRSVNNIRDDFLKENGKWYERHYIKRISSYSGESITTDYISSTGSLSTGATVDYVLNEPEFTSCIQAQIEVLETLYNFVMANGLTGIETSTTSTVKPILKFLYYDKTEKDKSVYVFDKYQQLIAMFDNEDEDTLIKPYVSDKQNSLSTFTFSIPLNSEKWQQISNEENLYYTENKIFSPNFDGCFTTEVTEDNEDLVNVISYERIKLLERQFVKAWNSETGFANIDTFMCVILSNGDLPLKNNGELVNSNHPIGTSGYVLDALLYGTGWTTGLCDVEGIFDFETDQVDIYNNILKVQEIWGGIIVIDSVNKIIEHRDETVFLPYDGFEVRYQKNMESLEKRYNNKLITELCPLGEGGLNIKTINDGSEWITNYSYTSSKLQGIENNPDITDPVQLKKWGERKLKDLCKPSKELTVQTVLLNQLEGFEQETIGLNDIVDVLDYKYEQDLVELRVVEYNRDIWDNSDAEIVLSDITLDSTDIFKQTASARDSLNNGTVSSDRIVDFFNGGQSLSQSLVQVNETIINTKSDLEKTDQEIKATLQETKTEVDTLTNTVITQQTTINELKETINGLQNQLSVSGGANWIRNSVGIFGNEFWSGNVVSYTDTDVQLNNEARNAIQLQNGSIMQEVFNLRNGIYNLSFNYKKLKSLAEGSVTINGETINLTRSSWTSIERVLDIRDNHFEITFTADTSASFLISDLILIAGADKQVWTQNNNETTTDTVQIGKGIKVESSTMNIYTKIDADGNRIYNRDTGRAVATFTDKGTETANLVVEQTADIAKLYIQQVDGQIWLSSLI